jgi:polyhydroxyalkanoate synthase
MMMQAVEEAALDGPTKQRMRFFMRQYLDAAAPSNYLMTNPEALKAAIESRGETLHEGMKNLLADMEKGRISMTDESAFEVGRNIAVTPGSVVCQSELLHLIQYVPTTARVHERPLVMVPPCINKYYLMDLQPENSLVKYAVEQGHTVFMVSWRNVKQKQAKKTWDDYIAELIEALEEARRITKVDRINALGFCIGGTLIASALPCWKSGARISW